MMFRYTAQVALDANQVQSVYSLGIQYSLSRPCHNTPVVMSCFALLHAYRFSDCFSQLQLLVHTLHPHSAVYDVSQSAHRLHTLSSAAPGQVVTAYMHCLYALLLHQQQLLANALHVCMYGAQLQLQSNTCGQVLAMSRLMLLQAMVKDHKLNSMLLPASKLKQMLRSHSMYSQNPAARCGFRVPNKRLW